jgi:hypothetical protein
MVPDLHRPRGTHPARRRPPVLVSVEDKLAALVACGDP